MRAIPSLVPKMRAERRLPRERAADTVPQSDTLTQQRGHPSRLPHHQPQCRGAARHRLSPGEAHGADPPASGGAGYDIVAYRWTLMRLVVDSTMRVTLKSDSQTCHLLRDGAESTQVLAGWSE